jgi:hypothetical protein
MRRAAIAPSAGIAFARSLLGTEQPSAPIGAEHLLPDGIVKIFPHS